MTREEKREQIEKSRPKKTLGTSPKQPDTNTHTISPRSNQTSKISISQANSNDVIIQPLLIPQPNQTSGNTLRSVTSGMTTHEIYEVHPLSAVDMTHLSPSLLLKLLGEPNKLLTSDSERDAYSARI